MNRLFVVILISIFSSSCNYENNKDYIQINEYGIKDMSIIIGDKYVQRNDFLESSKGGMCAFYVYNFSDELNIDLNYYNSELGDIIISNTTKVMTDKGIKIGDKLDDILSSYKGYHVEKTKVMDGGDSNQYWLYKVYKDKNSKNFIAFNVLGGKVDTIYVSRKDFNDFSCSDSEGEI